MLLPLTKYFFIILGSLYLFKKLLHISTNPKSCLSDVGCSLFLSIISQCVKQYVGVLDFCILVLLLSLFLKLRYKYSYKSCTITATISFTIASFASSIAVFFTLPLKLMFTLIGFDGFGSKFVSYFVIGSTQMLLVKLPFFLKRLKNGMPFLQQGKFEDTGFVISILTLLIIAIYRDSPNTDFRITLLTFFLPFIAGIILLFSWWHRRLRASYLEKLRARETESLKQEIIRLQEEISLLKQDNRDLSKLIHKDNKLIPAMEYTVSSLFQSAVFKDVQSKEQTENLLTQLKSISKERHGILVSCENTYQQTSRTGIISVDAMQHYMEQKAHTLGISFRFTFVENIKTLTDLVGENMLTTLIADLTENAFISTRECEQKHVLVDIGIENHIYVLSVFDSGKYFDKNVLLHLGIRRFTTYPKEGGSGIGLMTAFEIMDKYKASFLLDECTDDATYTKVVSICFDGLGQIRVRSHRPDILDLRCNRTDILFY